MATDSDIKGKITNISLIFIGGIIIVIHLILFRYNKFLFTAFVCLYVITYSILVTVYLYKKKECANGTDFNIMVYFSIYTIAMEVMIFLLSIIFMIYESYKTPVYKY